MAKQKITYRFADGSLSTKIVEVKYAHINKPDEEYDRYAITVRLDPDAEGTKALFDETLKFENEIREEAGHDPVDIPSNWTRKGKPSKDEDGYWLITMQLKPLDKDGNARAPKVSDVYGVESGKVNIWGGDKVIVYFSLGCWYAKDGAGSKYFLQGVQQIKPGDDNTGGGGGFKFKDMSGALQEEIAKSKPAATSVVIETDEDDNDDIPF